MRALKWLGGTVAVLFVVIALFFTFGLSLLKGPITRAVSDATGRELVIEGKLRPVWSWVHPRLRAHDRHLASEPLSSLTLGPGMISQGMMEG